MSEEIAIAGADLATVEQLRQRVTQAEADAAALRQAIWSAHFDIHYRHKDHWTWEECPKPTCYPLREALATGAGTAFLEERTQYRKALDIAMQENEQRMLTERGLLAELEAARIGLAAERELRARSEMIVLAARHVVAGPESSNYTKLAAALDAYDKTKARST